MGTAQRRSAVHCCRMGWQVDLFIVGGDGRTDQHGKTLLTMDWTAVSQWLTILNGVSVLHLISWSSLPEWVDHLLDHNSSPMAAGLEP